MSHYLPEDRRIRRPPHSTRRNLQSRPGTSNHALPKPVVRSQLGTYGVSTPPCGIVFGLAAPYLFEIDALAPSVVTVDGTLPLTVSQVWSFTTIWCLNDMTAVALAPCFVGGRATFAPSICSISWSIAPIGAIEGIIRIRSRQ